MTDAPAPGDRRGIFREVADRTWVARHDWFDVNVTLVAGTTGTVVVDTHASGRAARGVVAAMAAVADLPPVVAVVNTHEHFDHTFGNATMREHVGGVPIHAHRHAADRTRAAGERIKAAYGDDVEDRHRDDVLATTIVPADHVFTTRATLDLGDRTVVLVHPGRGHTGGDLVVHVPDADVVVAGDLVEESAPPALGPDSFPLDWPGSLDVVVDLAGADTVVVPGHGAVVDRAFVVDQQAGLAQVADTIRGLVAADIHLVDALASASWPWPVDVLEHAVARGYAHLDAAPGPSTN